MQLSPAQIETLARDGFLVLPELFTRNEIDILRAEVPRLMAEISPDSTREASGTGVRNMLGLHRRNAVYARLARHPRLLEPALQVLGEDVYMQQCKINVKSAFRGDGFDWHTDFATHHSRDGVPEPLALNLHVFLDDVTEFNGPMYFAPGSHLMDVKAERGIDGLKWELWTIPDREVERVIGETGLGQGRARHCRHVRRQAAACLTGEHLAVVALDLFGHRQPGIEPLDQTGHFQHPARTGFHPVDAVGRSLPARPGGVIYPASAVAMRAWNQATPCSWRGLKGPGR